MAERGPTRSCLGLHHRWQAGTFILLSPAHQGPVSLASGLVSVGWEWGSCCFRYLPEMPSMSKAECRAGILEKKRLPQASAGQTRVYGKEGRGCFHIAPTWCQTQLPLVSPTPLPHHPAPSSALRFVRMAEDEAVICPRPPTQAQAEQGSPGDGLWPQGLPTPLHRGVLPHTSSVPALSGPLEETPHPAGIRTGPWGLLFDSGFPSLFAPKFSA